jgi:uncharacterized membrane protein (GlpM family)
MQNTDLFVAFEVIVAMIVKSSGRQPMVRENILVVRGEIWTLLAMFMFIILFHYIISNKQQQVSH